MTRYVGALDQGTTSTRFMVFDTEGSVVSVARKEHGQIYPRPSWVERDRLEIWRNTEDVAAAALAGAGLRPAGSIAIPGGARAVAPRQPRSHPRERRNRKPCPGRRGQRRCFISSPPFPGCSLHIGRRTPAAPSSDSRATRTAATSPVRHARRSPTRGRLRGWPRRRYLVEPGRARPPLERRQAVASGHGRRRARTLLPALEEGRHAFVRLGRDALARIRALTSAPRVLFL